jgi:serine/threonine protein kinase
VGLQLLTAFEALHSIGMLHCDLKPDNIMIGKHRDPGSVNNLVLIDFSLAVPYVRNKNTWQKPKDDTEHIEPGPAK